MHNINKNLSANSKNTDINQGNKCYLYARVFCPRCGGFNICKHRLLSRKYLCNDCGYKWIS